MVIKEGMSMDSEKKNGTAMLFCLYGKWIKRVTTRNGKDGIKISFQVISTLLATLFT